MVANTIKKALPYILLLLFVFGLYGFWSIVDLGIYSDDWPVLASLDYGKPSSLQAYTTQFLSLEGIWYRAPEVPLVILINYLGYMTGNYALIFNFSILFFNFILSILIFKILNVYFKNTTQSLLSSMLAISYFGRDSTIYWFSTKMQLIGAIFFFLTIYLVFKIKKVHILNAILIFALSLISVFCYESMTILPAVVFCQLIIDPRGKNFISKVTLLISSTVGTLAVIFYKLYLFQKIFHIPPSKVLFIVDKQRDLLRSIYVYVKTAYGELTISTLFNKQYDHLTFNQGSLYFYLFILLIFFSLISLYIWNREVRSNFNTTKLCMFLFSFFILWALFFAILNNGKYNLELTGKGSRGSFLGSIVMGMLISSLLVNFKKPFLVYGLTFLLIILNVSSSLYIRSDYVKSYKLQKQLFQSLPVPKSIPESDIYVAFIRPDNMNKTKLNIPIISDFWTIKAMIQLKYHKENSYANIYSNADSLNLKNGYLYDADYPDKRFDKRSVYIIGSDYKLSRLHNKKAI